MHRLASRAPERPRTTPREAAELSLAELEAALVRLRVLTEPDWGRATDCTGGGSPTWWRTWSAPTRHRPTP
jgi:hypothetical protein